MANRRPPWKIPAVINPPERRCVQINIPDDPEHIAIFWGVLRSLSDWQRWEREPTKSGTLVAQVWSEVVYAIEWEDSCMGCCPQPTNRRYNEAGELEVSYDGGETWSPAPDADDRFSGIISPPITVAEGQETKCVGATAAEEYVKQNMIESLETGATFADINTVGVAIVALLGVTGIGILIAGLSAAIFTAGVSAVQAAFTAEVWEQFRCIMYCHASEDASFTVDGWQSVKHDILERFTGAVSAVLYNWVNSVGPVGLTNAMRSGFAASGDCSGCECGLDLVWESLPEQVSIGTVEFQGDGVWRFTLGTRDFEGNLHSAGAFKDDTGQCFKVTAIDLISGSFTRSYRVLCAGGEGFADFIDECISVGSLDRYLGSPLIETVVVDLHAELC